MSPRFFLLIPVFFLFMVVPALAQTCSCAGAPLVSSQSTGSSTAGEWLFGLTYEFHEISALFSGDNRLEDQTVSRNTQSVLFEIHYGLTDRLSLSGTFSYVHKEANTGLHLPSGGVTTTTQGLGDGIMMVRYILHQQTLWRQYHLVVGAGTKIPFGTTSLAQDGFALNADMQPGTGAWDGVLMSYASVSFLPYTSLNLFLINTYRQTGSNERFAENDRYRFGNELVSNLGISNALLGDLSYMLTFRYRSSSFDRLNGSNLPNTGGNWFSVVPSVSYPISDRASFRLSGQIPLYQNVNGTQPTTSFALSGSLFVNFNRNKNDGFIYGNAQ